MLKFIMPAISPIIFIKPIITVAFVVDDISMIFVL